MSIWGRIKRSTASRVHLHLMWWDRMVCLEPWCLADSAFGLSMPADLILTWGASPSVRVSFRGCPPRKAYECLLAGKSTSPEIHDGHRELSCEGILSAHQSHEEKMKISIVVFSCLLTAMVAQDASAALKIMHFPPCPEGVVDKKTCECRVFMSTRFHICHPGQYCLRNAFHGMCW